MYVNIIRSYRDVIAICDSELIGKRFEQDKLQLDVKENFFKGEEKSSEQVEEIITQMSAEDATFNIIGKKSINIALKTKLISQEGIKIINGIPFALVLI